jgi:hypothetical protein
VRQVPALDATPFGIGGDGRVARHFHRYFTLLGLSVCLWSRRLPELPSPEAQASCRTVLLLIRDDAVFSILLWVNLFDELRARFGLPASAARPFLARVAANLMGDRIGALTGPASRGDPGAMAANLRALDGDPFHAVYSAFVRVYEQRP